MKLSILSDNIISQSSDLTWPSQYFPISVSHNVYGSGVLALCTVMFAMHVAAKSRPPLSTRRMVICLENMAGCTAKTEQKHYVSKMSDKLEPQRLDENTPTRFLNCQKPINTHESKWT